ncbi:MAG: VOC family protein [Cyanobacteria bacterium J06641_5]
MRIDRICFYLDDAERWRNWFVERLGWRAIASEVIDATRWETVRSGGVTFGLASALLPTSPVARYLQAHPPGVAEIVLEVTDIGAIVARASGASTCLSEASVTAGVRVMSPAGVAFVLKPPTEKVASDGWAAAIDHVVLNVAAATYAPVLDWCERVLGFERRQRFDVQTPRSGLISQVLVHPDGGLRLPVNAPTSANSQIQEFLDCNRGPGVQHVALATPEILRVVRQLRRSGVAFLEVSEQYYDRLAARYPNLSASEREDLRAARVLVDCPSARSHLLQIFTQPLFAQPTFFLELIERRGRAGGFGEGNFRALFEAIEREQVRRFGQTVTQFE